MTGRYRRCLLHEREDAACCCCCYRFLLHLHCSCCCRYPGVDDSLHSGCQCALLATAHREREEVEEVNDSGSRRSVVQRAAAGAGSATQPTAGPQLTVLSAAMISPSAWSSLLVPAAEAAAGAALMTATQQQQSSGHDEENPCRHRLTLQRRWVRRLHLRSPHRSLQRIHCETHLPPRCLSQQHDARPAVVTT